MREFLIQDGAIQAKTLEELLWTPVSLGMDFFSAGKTALRSANHASIALLRVRSGQSLVADASLRARLACLVDAFPEASVEVHGLKEHSSLEDKWNAVAGRVSHHRGQLRLLDAMSWNLVDIEGNKGSATTGLAQLHPIRMRKDAPVTICDQSGLDIHFLRVLRRGVLCSCAILAGALTSGDVQVPSSLPDYFIFL